jgi:hypothetical protein
MTNERSAQCPSRSPRQRHRRRHANYALSGIIDVIYWIEHEQMPRSDDELQEVKHELINAAKLIVADFKRRF